MEKNPVNEGLLEYLFNRQPIKYLVGDFFWISYPHGAYRATKLTKEDVIDALGCKIDDDGDHYDLTRDAGHRCMPKQEEDE